ncbi:hypothetical protein [Nocardia sp. NPDC050793]|uniref:hypothetical protein n=1 Tax=Nocardia sp. NPDC050793 TaxID=3155159 RepID=UPI0034114257
MQYNGHGWSAPGPAQGYYPGGAPGYSPAPGMPMAPGYGPGFPHGAPPRRSSSVVGWVLGGVGAVLVVVLIAVVAIAYAANRATDEDDMARLFPGLARHVSSGAGLGYDGQSCFWRDAGERVVAPQDDTLRLGNWTGAWDCWGMFDKPTYVVLAYADRSDVEAVVTGLPRNTESFGYDDSDAYYNAYSWQTPDSGSSVQFWKAHAFRNGERSRFLVLAQEKHWPRLNQGKNKHDFDRWCVAMPFS